MSEFSDFTDAILDRLLATAGLNDIIVLMEDAQDLETQIEKVMGDAGMLILIGEPRMDNTLQSLKGPANMKIFSALSIGENAVMWRDQPALVAGPALYDGSGIASYVSLEGALTPGARYQWIPGANETQIASGDAVLNGPGFLVPETNSADVTGVPDAPFTGQLFAPTIKPHCKTVADIVVKALQGLSVIGFEPLRVLRAFPVPSKTRQLYEIEIESQTIVQATE